jgi:hypothetical protein
MRVNNVLTAPVLTSSVRCIVSVRAADNFEVSNPSQLPSNVSFLSLQSQDVYGEPQKQVAGNNPGSIDSNLYLVYAGEAVKSLRQLLRRTNLSYVHSEPTTMIDDENYIVKQKFGRFPCYRGYDTIGGIHTAKGIIATTTTFKYNFVQMTAYNWLAPAFIAQRGSMIWTFNVQSPSTQSSVKVYRAPQNNSATSNSFSSALNGSVSANAKYYLANTDAGIAGMALTNQLTNSGLSVLCPMYSALRFESTNPRKINDVSSIDGADHDGLILEVATIGNSATASTDFRIWKYVSIGTDFNLHFFLNVPTLYFLSSDPVAV